ncbi:MAG: gluconokinase [Roseiarcus sp.]
MSASTSRPQSAPRFALVVMGVSGSGKTVVGTAIANALGIAFFDGDDLHSAEARAKMTAGIPLNDEDRAPWLTRIGVLLADAVAHPDGVVVACSALRRGYRDRLRAIAGPSLRFLFLKGDKARMRERVAQRKGHYMPASLIDSQFAALESPEGESDVVTLAADADLSQALRETIERLFGCRRPSGLIESRQKRDVALQTPGVHLVTKFG